MLEGELPTVIASRYRVLGEIGKGGIGRVYRVEHVHTGEHLALKVLLAYRGASADTVERFKQEARIPALIKSDHVVKVTDADVAPELGGAPFFVMELLDGVDLEQHVVMNGPLPRGEVVEIFAQVARALDKAHSAGVVHRDLKPANIFLHRREGGSMGTMVKILDFGISKVPPGGLGDGGGGGLTRTGMLMGTPPYMSPEQMRGRAEKITSATDIWAQGLIAFKLLAGRSYWTGMTLPELVLEITSDPMPPASHRASSLPTAFDAWFARSCNRDPAARWPHASAQAAALAEALGVDFLPAMSKAPATGIRLPLPNVDITTTSEPSQKSASPFAPPLADSAFAGSPDAGSPMTAASVRVRAEADPTPAGPTPPMMSERTVLATSKRHAAATAAGGASSRQREEGERRQVTVLSYTINVLGPDGSDVDPEDLDQVSAESNQVFADVLSTLGELTTRPGVDGQLVYFGYPVAHEDDARRAVMAGLGIVEATEELNKRIQRDAGIGISVRVGIHTGLVMIGDSSRRADSQTIVGQALNMAAGIDQVAEPNTVAISAATKRLVAEQFVFVRLGTRKVLGSAQGVELFRVLPADETTGEAEVRTAPFVGRESEIGLLRDRWEQTSVGAGHVVIIMAEAGIGKSRILSAFRHELEGERFQWLECRCSQYFENTAFHPLIDFLQRTARISRTDSAEQKRDKLEQALRPYSLPPDALSLLAPLLAPSLVENAAPLNLSPQRQKQKTHEAFLALLQEITAKEPLCFIVEDLHWADPSSLELLSLLVDQGPTSGILAIMTCRTSFRPPWTARSHISQIALSKLPRKRIETMVLGLTKGKALPPVVLDQLVAKTDGVPLFVEELTKMILESNLVVERDGHYELTGPLPALAIPTTLRDSLTARLDRLGRAKATAQLAATLGREFSYEVLKAVSPLDEQTLKDDLTLLVDCELVYQKGLFPRAVFTFKHSLVQDAAYESLRKNNRRQIHQQIAEALAGRFPEMNENQPEVLAHHYAEGGLPEKAAGCLLRAGQSALQRSANMESISHLRKGIALLEGIPHAPERDHLEITLRSTLGAPLMASSGYGAPELEATYAAAMALTKQVDGDPREIVPVLWGLWIFYHVRAKYSDARGLAEQLLTLTDGADDSGMRLCAHLARGATAFLSGQLSQGRDHLFKSLTLYDPVAHRSHAYLYGQDSGMFCRVMLGWDLWILGSPDAALTMLEEAVALAKGLSHPNSLGFALGILSLIHQLRGESALAEQRAADLIALSTEQKLVHWAQVGHMVHGWGVKESGKIAEGLEEMQAGRNVWRMIGSRSADSHWDAMLIQTYIEAGRAEEAKAMLAATRAFVAEGGETYMIPELDRLEGEIALALSDDQVAAEACFHRGILEAQSTGALSLELRTALSLDRLWRRQGKVDAARPLLERIYGWFTEGFETRDLKLAMESLAPVNSSKSA